MGTLIAIAYIAGIFKGFGAGFLLGFISIFIPPVAIFMLFY